MLVNTSQFSKDFLIRFTGSLKELPKVTRVPKVPKVEEEY